MGAKATGVLNSNRLDLWRRGVVVEASPTGDDTILNDTFNIDRSIVPHRINTVRFFHQAKAVIEVLCRFRCRFNVGRHGQAETDSVLDVKYRSPLTVHTPKNLPRMREALLRSLDIRRPNSLVFEIWPLKSLTLCRRRSDFINTRSKMPNNFIRDKEEGWILYSHHWLATERT